VLRAAQGADGFGERRLCFWCPLGTSQIAVPVSYLTPKHGLMGFGRGVSHHGRTDSSSVGRAMENKKTDFHFAVRGLRCESLGLTAQSRKRLVWMSMPRRLLSQWRNRTVRFDPWA
jgi:hypothetical protein